MDTTNTHYAYAHKHTHTQSTYMHYITNTVTMDGTLYTVYVHMCIVHTLIMHTDVHICIPYLLNLWHTFE